MESTGVIICILEDLPDSTRIICVNSAIFSNSSCGVHWSHYLYSNGILADSTRVVCLNSAILSNSLHGVHWSHYLYSRRSS